MMNYNELVQNTARNILSVSVADGIICADKIFVTVNPTATKKERRKFVMDTLDAVNKLLGISWED